MRAYRAQAEQTRGRDGGRRADVPPTFAQRVLALQRAAGNAVVARAVEEERHEHGAACGHETAEQPVVERSSAQPSSVLDAVSSPGRPLDARVMEKAEQGYGMSFRHVRVHDDPTAQRSATAFGARAYTTGHDIVVGPRGADDETIFHELDHVRQQSMGPVAGTDNGSGVAVSSQDDPFELSASANGRRMAQGGMPDLSGPGSGASGTAAGSGGRVTVARMVSGNGWKMHKADRGLEFEIEDSHGPVIGRYVRSGSDGREIFDTPQGRIRVYPSEILGPRATVGGLHPPGQVRPPEDNLQDRDEVLLSEANASGARARLRRDPRAAERIAVTTYEEEPDYADYPQNREALRRQGVPVLNSFDINAARDRQPPQQSRSGPPPELQHAARAAGNSRLLHPEAHQGHHSDPRADRPRRHASEYHRAPPEPVREAGDPQQHLRSGEREGRAGEREDGQRLLRRRGARGGRLQPPAVHEGRGCLRREP